MDKAYRMSALHSDQTIGGLTMDDIEKYSVNSKNINTDAMISEINTLNENNITVSHLYRNIEQYKED